MSDSKEMTVAEAQPPQQIALTVQERAVIALGGTERENELKALAQKYADITEVKNKAGRQQVHGAAMELANQRVATKKTGEVAREDAVALQKAVIERQKYLIGLTEPEEKRLITLRDGWDEAEAAEKAAKVAAEQKRIADIRSRIDAFRNAPAEMVGKSAEQIGACADHLSETIIALEEFEGSTGEAIMARNAAVARLREMQAAQAAHEAEQARLAAERAQLERERAESAERERQAATARAEQERKDREAREAEDALVDSIWKNARRIESNTAPYILKAIGAFESMAKDWENDPRQRVSGAIASTRAEMQAKLRDAEEAATREARDAELRRQRETEESRLRAERELEERRLADARAEIERQKAEIAAAKAEQERREREAREAMEAWEREQELAAAHDEALAENARIEAELAEAKRQADKAHAAEQERIRCAQAEFEATGPEDWEIVQVVADHYDVSADVARHWLARHVWMEKAA